MSQTTDFVFLQSSDGFDRFVDSDGSLTLQLRVTAYCLYHGERKAKTKLQNE